MKYSETLEKVTALLRAKNIRFALAGGLVASIYRSDERVTKDLDVLFFAGNDSEISASEILKSLDLAPQPVRKADLEGGPLHARKRGTTPIFIVRGVGKHAEQVPVDFLLSTIPWVSMALERAEVNLIDFGFARLPCITCEDIIVSKLYALSNRSDRFKDLDDLQNIFRYRKDKLDLNYISDRIIELRLGIPSMLRDDIPRVLIRAAKIRK